MTTHFDECAEGWSLHQNQRRGGVAPLILTDFGGLGGRVSFIYAQSDAWRAARDERGR